MPFRTACSRECPHKWEVARRPQQALLLLLERRVCRTRRWKRDLGLVKHRHRVPHLHRNPLANRLVDRLLPLMLHRTVNQAVHRRRHQHRRLLVHPRRQTLAPGGRATSSVQLLRQDRGLLVLQPLWALAVETEMELEAVATRVPGRRKMHQPVEEELRSCRRQDGHLGGPAVVHPRTSRPLSRH